jgi:hypothetical protein
MEFESSACCLFLTGTSAILHGSSIWTKFYFNKWTQRKRLHYFPTFNETTHIYPVLRRALSYFSWNITSVTINGYHCACKCGHLLISSRHEPHPNWKSGWKLHHQTGSASCGSKRWFNEPPYLTPENKNRISFSSHFEKSSCRAQ